MTVKLNSNILLFLITVIALSAVFKYDFPNNSQKSECEYELPSHDELINEFIIPDTSIEPTLPAEEIKSVPASTSTEELSTEFSLPGDEGILDSRTALPAGISLNRPAASVKFSNPLDKGRVSSLFGFRVNPVTAVYKFHKGYDIAAPYQQEIKSISDGTVTYIGYDKNGYGNYLKVTHSNNIVSLYAHCSKILAEKGDTVKAGQKIALVGSTGGSTGNHLHLEIIIDGIRYDPEWFFGGIYD